MAFLFYQNVRLNTLNGMKIGIKKNSFYFELSQKIAHSNDCYSTPLSFHYHLHSYSVNGKKSMVDTVF